MEESLINFQTISPKFLKEVLKMLLFLNPSNLYVQKLIIPLNRVFDISCSDSSIIINYDSGELVELAENKFAKKLESVRISYNSADEVNKITRQFYKAVASGSNAFYFGDSEEKTEEKKN